MAVHDTLEATYGAIECESGNVEVQWNNMKKYVLDTMSDLVRKDNKIKKTTDYTQNDQENG
jgi:hypothetical protein